MKRSDISALTGLTQSAIRHAETTALAKIQAGLEAAGLSDRQALEVIAAALDTLAAEDLADQVIESINRDALLALRDAGVVELDAQTWLHLLFDRGMEQTA